MKKRIKKDIKRMDYSRINSLKLILEDIIKTKVIKGSKFKFFINRLLFYLSVFLQNRKIEKFRLKLGKEEFIIKNKYGLFYGYFNDDSLDIYSPYFEYTLQHWFNYDKRKRIFLDIGANRGRYSIQAINYLGYEKVIAFEPLMINWHILNKNIEINALSERINIYKLALSNDNTYKKIFFDENNTGLASLEGDILNLKDKYEIIETRKLDDIFSDDNIISNISFIKIDVEGHEFNVLKRGINFFRKLKEDTCLMIEIFENNPNINETKKLIDSFGFRLKEKIGDNYLFIKEV